MMCSTLLYITTLPLNFIFKAGPLQSERSTSVQSSKVAAEAPSRKSPMGFWALSIRAATELRYRFLPYCIRVCNYSNSNYSSTGIKLPFLSTYSIVPVSSSPILTTALPDSSKGLAASNWGLIITLPVLSM